MKLTRLLLLALFVLAGCDSGGDDSLDIYGTWETRGDDIIFLVITESTVSGYDFMGDEFDQGPDCYIIDHTPVESISDTAIVITDEDLGSISASVSISGDRMILTVLGFSETYYRSTRQVSSFTPECADVSKKPS